MPPFLIIAPIDAPIKNKKIQEKINVYFSFIVRV